MNMAKKGKKLLALMLVAALVLGGGNGGVIQAAEDYEVKDPVNTMADGTGITTLGLCVLWKLHTKGYQW